MLLSCIKKYKIYNSKIGGVFCQYNRTLAVSRSRARKQTNQYNRVTHHLCLEWKMINGICFDVEIE